MIDHTLINPYNLFGARGIAMLLYNMATFDKYNGRVIEIIED